MLDDCENHSASCCEIRLEPSPILTKVSAAGVGTTPGEGPETQRTHCRPGEGASRRPEEDRRARKADHGTRKANHRTRKANHRLGTTARPAQEELHKLFQAPFLRWFGRRAKTARPQAQEPTEARGNFGPHLTALIAYWTVVCRVPRRLVEAMLGDVLGLEISLGSTQKAWEEVSQAVAQPCQQWQEQWPREAVRNVDETGWRSNGDKRWIWTFVAKQFVFYAVASTRSAAVLVALLGTVFRGILCGDRLPVYFSYHSGRMQLCWAHLKRDILGIAEDARSRSAQQFGRDALAVVARLFRLWYRFRGDLRDRRGNPQPINRRQLLRKSIPLQKKLFALAETHLDHANKEVRNLATALYVHCERWFTFLEVKGVEPTNNGAERALRTAVQWRKICFGNRSRSGEIATARLLTVTQTCKRQQRHVLGYLTEAVRCHRRQIAAPSLLRRRI